MLQNHIIDDIDRKIMQFRALGYHQSQISGMLNMSQSAISQRIEKIRQQAEGSSDIDKLFWTMLLGAGAIYLLSKALEKK